MDIETYEKAGKLISEINSGKEAVETLSDINNSINLDVNCTIDIKCNDARILLPKSIIKKSIEYMLTMLKVEQEALESDLRWL